MHQICRSKHPSTRKVLLGGWFEEKGPCWCFDLQWFDSGIVAGELGSIVSRAIGRFKCACRGPTDSARFRGDAAFAGAKLKKPGIEGSEHSRCALGRAAARADTANSAISRNLAESDC